MGPNLHLEGPPPVPVVHGELLEPPEVNRPEGSEVAVPEAEEEPGARQDDPGAEARVQMKVAFLPLGRPPHPEDEIGLVPEDGCRHRFQGLDLGPGVGVEEGEHGRGIGEGREMFDPPETRRAVAPLLLPEHDGSLLLGDPGRVVGGAVVHDHRAPHAPLPEPVEKGRERRLLVEGRDEDRHRGEGDR